MHAPSMHCSLIVHSSQSGACSDITFKVGNQSFSAHKSIIAMRSPVFRGMIEAGCTEASTGTVKVEDVDPAAFRQMLRFIYTDACEEGAIEGENMAAHLLVAAMHAISTREAASDV